MRNSLNIGALAILLTGLWSGGLLAQTRTSRSLPTATVSPQQTSRFDGEKGLFVPEWKADMQVNARESLDEMLTAPFFEDGSLDRQVVNLPYYDLVVPISSTDILGISSAEPEGVVESSTNLFRTSMQQSGIPQDAAWYPSSHVVLGDVEIRRGQHYQHVHIYPIRVNRSGDRMQKAKAVSYRLQRRSGARKSLTNSNERVFNNNSVLASGTWYKMSIVQDGLYKLDYNYLQSIGINPASVDPRTIRIHGNGGGMLPQTVGEFPHDDLVENNIWVSGQADGSFDQGDYVLFYGKGPHTWKYNDKLDRFVHQYNVYSDSAAYFITWNNGNGKRVTTQAVSGAPTATPASARKMGFYEEDSFNPLKSGRVWLGESFDLTTTKTFSIPTPKVASGTNAKVTVRLGAQSNSPSYFSIKESNNTYANLSIANTNSNIYGSFYYRSNYTTFEVPASRLGDNSVDVELTYSKPLTSSVGYLDYIEAEYMYNLNLSGAPVMTFSVADNVAPGQIHQYTMPGGGNHRLWDVTDPVNVIERPMNGGTFVTDADSIKSFLAFNATNTLTPVSAQRVANQNLHALAQTDYVIVTHPNFLSAANRLAEFHRNHFSRIVHVVPIQQVYNEFSSGVQDPAAIRDFMKMFYQRGLQNSSRMPRYLLLLGDGSYDYKDRVASGITNFIPTYQSRKSQRPTESYVSDDFYGFLDDGEGYWGENAGLEGGVKDILYWAEGDTAINTYGLDIAVSRMPVATSAEANAMVNKVIDYISNPEGFGPWRNKVVLVADHKDADGVIHISQADSYTPGIEATNPCINVDKIYMDNYLRENTASGSRFPDGKDALLNALDEGSLIVNYTGHGGEVGWSNSSILDISDINKLANGNRTPAYITATCEFGRWDDPGRRSGGEALYLREGGGAIAMFTTVRVVYSGPNYVLNQNFYKHVLRWDSTEGRWPTMGEVFMRTKNDSWIGGINNRNFSLMGDPAMPLAYPSLRATITKINGLDVRDTVPDSLGALSLVTIEGEIQTPTGQLVPDFNGTLAATVFDKPSRFTTKRAPFTFLWRKNRVFNGAATISNGTFSFQFVVPIDVSYEDGLGKISLYAAGNTIDGAGCNNNLFIGGSSGTSITDDRGPELDLYMNDVSFPDGGMVGPDPLLLAEVFDENGLNTVGTGIGHELTAVLDGNENDVIVLNDFYTANSNSYKEGVIRYPFDDLAEGEHSLEVKVWDVANNSSKARLTFVVANDATFALGHVLNYPNPFSTNTKFFIEHNRNGRLLKVQVRVYTVAGNLVKTLEDTFFSEGNLYSNLEWDGLDDYGDVLGRGVYVYQVLVRDEESGDQVTQFEKLVLLR